MPSIPKLTTREEVLIANLLHGLCNAAKLGITPLDQQIEFHPMKIFRSLKKHGAFDLLSNVFNNWPANEHNPFVLPVTLYAIYESADSPYNTAEFIVIAQGQFARQWPIIGLLQAVILLSNNSADRVRAVRRLIPAGVDPNTITNTKILQEFVQKEGCIRDDMAFDLLQELTPLGIAVIFNDRDLAHTLLTLGANACLVLFPVVFRFILFSLPIHIFCSFAIDITHAIY